MLQSAFIRNLYSQNPSIHKKRLLVNIFLFSEVEQKPLIFIYNEKINCNSKAIFSSRFLNNKVISHSKTVMHMLYKDLNLNLFIHVCTYINVDAGNVILFLQCQSLTQNSEYSKFKITAIFLPLIIVISCTLLRRRTLSLHKCR